MKKRLEIAFNTNARGSFTIETALLMPIVLMVMLLFFYFIILMYDRGVMQEAVCRGTKQVFYSKGQSNSEIEEDCTKIILADLEERLICMKDTQITVRIKGSEVEGFAYGELDIPELFIWEGMNLQDLWIVEVSWSEPTGNAAEVIRMFQQAENIYHAVSDNAEGENPEEITESE